METNIYVELFSNKLTATIILETPSDGDLFACYLIKDGNVIVRDYNYSEINVFEWELEVSGTYAAQGFVKRGDKKSTFSSRKVNYFSTDLREEYCSFLNQNATIDISPPSYCRLAYPHQDIALIYGTTRTDEKTQGIEEFSREEGFFFANFDILGQNSCYLLATQPINQIDHLYYVYSGTTKFESNLVFGSDDLSEFDNITKIEEGIGDFLLAYFDGEKAQISTDYFGVCKVYYYFKDNIFVASNRYHLLLLLLNKMEIKLSLNTEKAIANLSNLTQPFQRNRHVNTALFS